MFLVSRGHCLCCLTFTVHAVSHALSGFQFTLAGNKSPEAFTSAFPNEQTASLVRGNGAWVLLSCPPCLPVLWSIRVSGVFTEGGRQSSESLKRGCCDPCMVKTRLSSCHVQAGDRELRPAGTCHPLTVSSSTVWPPTPHQPPPPPTPKPSNSPGHPLSATNDLTLRISNSCMSLLWETPGCLQSILLCSWLLERDHQLVHFAMTQKVARTGLVKPWFMSDLSLCSQILAQCRGACSVSFWWVNEYLSSQI